MKLARALELLEESGHETLTYYAFPDSHWLTLDKHSAQAHCAEDQAPHPRRRRNRPDTKPRLTVDRSKEVDSNGGLAMHLNPLSETNAARLSLTRRAAAWSTIALASGLLLGAPVGVGDAHAASTNTGGWTDVPPGTVMVTDDFSGAQQDKYARFRNGRLIITIPAGEAGDSPIFEEPPEITKMLGFGYLEVGADITHISGSHLDSSMEFFGGESGGHYRVDIESGNFSVTFWAPDANRPHIIKDWTPSPTIKSAIGSVNRLGYIDNGGSADIVINGQIVYHLVPNGQVPGHSISFSCTAFGKGTVSCALSKFTISTLPAGNAAAQGTPGKAAPSSQSRSTTAPAVQAAAIDPAIVGHWRLFLPTGKGAVVRLDLVIDANGHYAFTSDNPGVMQHSGTFTTTPNHHWMMTSPKYSDGGTYSMPDANTLDLIGKLGPGIWSRVS